MNPKLITELEPTALYDASKGYSIPRRNVRLTWRGDDAEHVYVSLVDMQPVLEGALPTGLYTGHVELGGAVVAIIHVELVSVDCR